MLIPFANLKDIALLVSNILRDFDPETMFWREESPIIFPNYDKDGFTPYKPVRKPFSVQIILESFSRSCGYKSYNALLADENRAEPLDVNLFDLNPAPRNEYYTEYWNTFINTMLQSIYTGFVNNSIPSYLTYRNFKCHEIKDRLAFIGLSINAICDVDTPNQTRYDFVESYYPIALSILFSAMEMGFEKKPTVPTFNLMIKPEFPNAIQKETQEGKHGWFIKDVPLKNFLVHEKWHEQDFIQFKSKLTDSMYALFGAGISFAAQGDNPLDSLVSLAVPYDLSRLNQHALAMKAVHIKMQGLAIQKANTVAADKNYYFDPYCQAINTFRSDFKPQELAWNVRQGLKQSPNLHNHEIYGNKAFWLNQCALFTKPSENLAAWNHATFEEVMQFIVSEQLHPYHPSEELKDAKRKHVFQFQIQGVSQFIKNTGNCYNVKEIPKRVTVYTNGRYHQLDPSILKMAVHSKLVTLLLRPNSQLDINTKYFGDLDTIEFDASSMTMHTAKNPKLKIKEVDWLSVNEKKSDLSFELNFTDLIYSISAHRLSPEHIKNLKAQPYPVQIDSDDEYYDFNSYEGSYEDLVFTQGKTKPGYFCELKIKLFEVPYQAISRYEPESGWNEVTVICKLPSLNPDQLEYLEIWQPNSDMNTAEENRNYGVMLFLSKLEMRPEFLQLIKDYLKWSKVQFKQFNSLLEDVRLEDASLDKHQFKNLYNYLTFYPMGKH